MINQILEADRVMQMYQAPQGENETLKDVRFQIEQGKSVSLTGPSGCGKSVLMPIIAGRNARHLEKCGAMGERPRRQPKSGNREHAGFQKILDNTRAEKAKA